MALDTDQQVGRQYRLIGLPASTWIDAKGRIVDRVSGAMAPDVLQEKTARVLAVLEGQPAQVHSVREVASQDDRHRVVATLGDQPLVREEDVERRTDLVLALEELDTRLVLDPSRVTDAAEIDQSRQHACRNLIDERWLVDAATAWRSVLVGSRPWRASRTDTV